MKRNPSLAAAGLLLFLTALNVPAIAAVDEAAAKSLAKKNDCGKCHAPDKTKKGPSYNSTLSDSIAIKC